MGPTRRLSWWETRHFLWEKSGWDMKLASPIHLGGVLNEVQRLLYRSGHQQTIFVGIFFFRSAT